MRNQSNVFRTTFIVHDNGRQSSGLPSVVLFVPFGSSSRSSAEKASFLRYADTTQHKKKEQLRKRAALFFALLRSSSSHVHFLRSSGLLHPQYSFIAFCFVNYASLHSAVLCLSPLIFSAVALSPSHRGLLRYRFALD
jgi:hypothetical protein